MKTIQKILTVLLIMLAAAVFLPCAVFADTIGNITAIQGDVDVLKPGMERAAPAALQQPVSEDDIIRTKSNAKAEITFVDDSIIRLAPGSRLQITEYLMEGSKRKSGVMNLFRGKVRAVVSKSRGFLSAAFGGGDRFEVRTPTAVAGVKGTDFFVSYNMGVTGIVVKEGRVDTFNPQMANQVVSVSAGNATFISEGKPPSPPRPAADVEVIRHTKDTDTGEKPKEKKEEPSTITASATAPPAGGTFGYEAPEGGAPPPLTGTVETVETVIIPSSESHTELLKDIAPPVIGIAGPPAFTNSSTANFTVTTNETANITYAMDSWGATSPNTTVDNFSIASLTEGTHILTVTAIDPAGNKSTQTYSFTTDYTPPAMTGVSGPTALTNSSSAAFGFTANEAASSYSYSLDGGATWVSTGSSLNLSAVPEGANTIKVRVTDLAGNTSVASLPYSWKTDYTAPASLTLTGTPASLTNINSATIGATATDANAVTYSYTLDGAASTGALTGLNEGSHIFKVIATDAAGNTSTTSYSWTTDYTAPVASIKPAAAPETGPAAAVNVSLGSNETATYSYQIDGGGWTATGSSLSLPGIAEGTHTIDYTATDTAGNTSAPASLSFDLSRYSLAGNVSDTSGWISGSVTSGEVAGISNQNWGGWINTMTGTGIYTLSPSSFTLNAGGTSTDTTTISNNGGYWIEIINGTSDGVSSLSGVSSLKYLSHDRLGTGTGVMTGSYDGFGAWSATDTGTYTETPLVWSGDVTADNNSNFYYSGAGLYSLDTSGPWLDIEGNSTGIMGYTASLWSDTNFKIMGAYNVANGIGYGPPYLWMPEIKIWGNVTTLTGMYQGFIGGVWKGDGTIDANVYSLYIDPSGNAGILKGDVTGAYYPQLSMFEADGTWTPTALTNGLDAATATVNIVSTDYGYNITSLGDFNGSYSITVAGNEGMFPYTDWRYSITGQDWGILKSIIGGWYCYGDCSSTPPDIWSLSTFVDLSSQGTVYGTQTESNGTVIEGAQTQWSNDVLKGKTYGYGADITNTPMTWISVGETVGTFDATALTWQAVQTSAWLDTNKFLAMTQTAQGQAALTALNIPFAEVGRANLTGAGNNMTVNMNDVTFFAYQTGAAPKIWATGNVNGTYTAPPVINTPVALTGNGLSADFTPKVWNTTNGNWMSTVNGGGAYSGTGTMNGTNVQMTGAAAGTGATAGAGSITGTGAGVAK